MKQNLDTNVQVLPVAGVRVHTVAAGIRYQNRPDLVLFELAPGSHTAALFTQNAFCAAPVEVAKTHLRESMPRYWLINTGNANAGMGEQGREDALACCVAVAGLTQVKATEVLPFSTGVIAERLPIEPIVKSLPSLVDGLNVSGWSLAASGIMTTDTKPKGASRQFEVSGQTYTISGIAKGAGMIKPNMATMLAFLATDCSVAPSILQSILAQATAASFNRISVDGDTSTNDACVFAATGLAANQPIETEKGELYQVLLAQTVDLCQELAIELVKDGEGASKCVTIEVAQAMSEQEAAKVAYTIAESPLCKTAFFASDPNWGRILAAVGRAGVAKLAVEKVQIYLDSLPLATAGAVAPDYIESRAQQIMAQSAFKIRIELGRGDACYQVWTTDLSYDYVRINAEYRT